METLSPEAAGAERSEFEALLAREWIDHQVVFSSVESSTGLYEQVEWRLNALLDDRRLRAVVAHTEMVGRGAWALTYSPEGGLRVRLRWRAPDEEQA